MGRITVFTSDGCTYCRQVRAALTSREIPFTDINIAHYPKKRADMLALTDRYTVPQGGAEETIKLLNTWDEELKGSTTTAKDRYEETIASEVGPYDVRLSAPTGPPVLNHMGLSVRRPKEITELNGKHFTTLQLTRELMKKMPRGDVTNFGFGGTQHNSFKGLEAVTALMQIFDLQSREEAVQLGMKLQRKHVIEHASKGDHTFGDNKHLFRLYALNTPHVLNSLRVWTQKSNDEPINVIFHLSKQWGKLESLHITADGLVDHATLRNDDFFWKFEDDVCELQKVSMKEMGTNEKTAFVINLYNLMIKYAFVKLGIPTTDFARLAFFNGVCVNVGCQILSLNDLEHGILRANARPPYKIMKQISFGDSLKKQLSLHEVDARIHFALNCGAKGCPAVKRYSVEALDEELRLAALAFCEQDSNVSIDEVNNVIGLSKIFYWYQSDFVSSKDKLPSKIAQYYLRGDKKEKLERLIANGRFSIKYLDYDWSTDHTNSMNFSKLSLKSFPAQMYASND